MTSDTCCQIGKNSVDLDASRRRRGKPTSRDVVQHAATKYGYEQTDLTDETMDYLWRASDKRSVEISYSRGGRSVRSVWVNGQLATIGSGRIQAIRALAGEKVIAESAAERRRRDRAAET